MLMCVKRRLCLRISIGSVGLQARAQLPVTLVLGMSISVAALRHMLPVKAADVLQAKEFRLVQVASQSLFIEFASARAAMRVMPNEAMQAASLLKAHEPLLSRNSSLQSQKQNPSSRG